MRLFCSTMLKMTHNKKGAASGALFIVLNSILCMRFCRRRPVVVMGEPPSKDCLVRCAFHGDRAIKELQKLLPIQHFFL